MKQRALILGLVLPFFLNLQIGLGRTQQLSFEALKRARLASGTFGSDEQICSSTIVSPTGYVITALHCLSECNEIENQFQRSKQSHSEIIKIDSGKVRGAVCGKYEFLNSQHWLKKPKIVHSGKGQVLFPDSSLAKMTQRTRRTLAESWEDFVILKFETDKALPCIPSSQKLPQVSDDVWSVHFPQSLGSTEGGTCNCQTLEPITNTPLGSKNQKTIDTLKQSFDFILPNFQKEFLSSGKVMKSVNPQKPVPATDEVYGANGNIISNLATNAGSSGAGVLNHLGELTGVYVASTDDRKVGVAHSIQSIRRSVASALGEAKAAEIFSCPP